MRAILIDPKAQTVTEVDHAGGCESIYALVGCSTFTVIALAGRDVMYLDDEGLLFEGEKPAFTFGDYPQPLVGRGLIVSTDEMGEDVAADMSLAAATAATRWMEPLLVTGFVTERGRVHHPVLGELNAVRTRVVFAPPKVGE